MSYEQRHQHIESIAARRRAVCHQIDMHSGTDADGLLAHIRLADALADMLSELIENDKTFTRLAGHELRVNAAQKAVDAGD